MDVGAIFIDINKWIIDINNSFIDMNQYNNVKTARYKNSHSNIANSYLLIFSIF